MGIKNFSKIFKPQKEITIKNFKENNINIIAIDAFNELYRALNSPVVLVDDNGNYTHHIKILLSNIIKRKQNNISEIWVFDYYDNSGIKYYNPIKKNEIKKRELMKSKKKYKNLTIKLLNEFIFILNKLNIPYIISPKNYEAEQIAACLSIDAVYTADPDALLFGAKNLILRKKNKLLLYNLNILCKEYQISKDDLIKIGIVLGCDFCMKTRGIGYKTILKKYKKIKLNNEQMKAFDYYKKKCNMKKLKWHNKTSRRVNKKNINELIDYLVEKKKFKRERIIKQFQKI